MGVEENVHPVLQIKEALSRRLEVIEELAAFRRATVMGLQLTFYPFC